MAIAAHTTPARLNPSWVPAPYPLGDLARFFNGRDDASAIVNNVPARPLTPAEAQAIDDLEHECDLISTRPTPFEVAWTLARVQERELVAC